MEQLIAQFMPLIIGLLLFVGLTEVFKRVALPRLKGWLGEYRVNSTIQRKLDPRNYHLLQNLTLPTPDGTTQIDHVVVSAFGIFVIETKLYQGWIFGSEKDTKWTQQNFKGKVQFQNPLRQNYKHIKTLAGLTEIPENLFKSVIVFAGGAEFKKEMPSNVLYLSQLAAHIKSFEEFLILDEQVPNISSAISGWAATVTMEQKREHVSNPHRNHQPVAVESAAPVCPRCGAQMLLRTSKKESNKFWGCPKFPRCRGTREVSG